MDPIKAPALTQYRAVHDSGQRRAKDIKLIVIHSTEAWPGFGSVQWFMNPASGGSANMVLDDNRAWRTLPDTTIPWAAPPKNTQGWHLEFAGFARWTTDQWMQHKNMLDRAAYKIALRAKWYGIPLRQLGTVGLRLGLKGVVYHSTISKAYGLSDHTDPGPGFPLKYVLAKANEFLKEL